jgi:hypothetical protein
MDRFLHRHGLRDDGSADGDAPAMRKRVAEFIDIRVQRGT